MGRRKVLILCIDAGSDAYLRATTLPALQGLARNGFWTDANAVIPSVTNVNNVSIATGTFPMTHGITTNYRVDRETGVGEFIEDARFLLAPTIFTRAKACGFASKTALFVTKQKLLRMLEAGTDIAVAAEAPPDTYIEQVGPPEPIYSAEINWWLLRAVRETLRTADPELVYCSTTDWSQHQYAPESAESQEHLAVLDEIIGEIVDDDPTREIYITADHGMLPKTRALDPGRVLRESGISASAIPIIKDRYVAHHNNLGGAAYVYLDSLNDAEAAIALLSGTPGIEEVYPTAAAASRFRLHAERIGDIFLLADKTTVFGELDVPIEPTTVRSHGSRHESYVPVIGYNSGWSASDFEDNVDVGRLFLESLA